jgi:hypothetical protein
LKINSPKCPVLRDPNPLNQAKEETQIIGETKNPIAGINV